jgi:hypothetical protein
VLDRNGDGIVTVEDLDVLTSGEGEGEGEGRPASVGAGTVAERYTLDEWCEAVAGSETVPEGVTTYLNTCIRLTLEMLAQRFATAQGGDWTSYGEEASLFPAFVDKPPPKELVERFS